MENIAFSNFLAVLQQDSESFLCVLPVELSHVENIKEQLSALLQSETCQSFSVTFRKCIVGILKKTEHRATQVRARNDYLALTALTLQTLSEEEDEEWRLLELQLISSPEKLMEEKKKIMREISKLQKLKKKVSEAFKRWQDTTTEENLLHADFSDTVANNCVTEPLMHSADLEELIINHFSNSYHTKKGSLLDKMAMKLLKYAVQDALIANTEALHGQMLLLLREQLAKVTPIIKPTQDQEITEKLKSSLSKKLTLAGGIDVRLTKITVLPENSLGTSTASEGEVEDPGESENDALHGENVSSPKRELLRKLTLQETILMNDNLDSEDQEFVKEVFTKFKSNLISLMDICSIKDQEQIFKFKKTLNSVSSMFPIHELGSNMHGMKLKIKDISLPQYSGKESDYFRFKADVLDLLNNSRHDNSSQTRALKSDCFKQCPNVLDLVRHCKTVPEIFEILDSRFGNIDRHSLMIIASIEKCPPAQETSKSIIALADCIFKINNDICGANALETVASFQTISKIKSKFSPLMSRDFVKQYGYLGKHDSISQWGFILDFLKQERDTQLSVSSFEVTGSTQPVKSSLQAKVNLAVSNDPSGKKCVLCDGNHLPFEKSCQMTGSFLTPKTREKAKAVGLCMTCLTPSCKDKHCKRNSFSCRKNCKENGKPLHRNICDCVASWNLHKNLNPNIAVKSCNITNNVSNYKIGPTVMLHEFVPIIDAQSKKPVRVAITYDMGATDSLCNAKVGIHGKSRDLGKLNIGGFSNDCNLQMKNAKQVSFTVQTKNGLKNVDSIQVSDLNVVSKCSIDVPNKWLPYFPQGFSNVGGRTDILLGGNCSHLFPKEIDRYTSGQECLILFQSEISGRYLLFGRDGNLVTFSQPADPSVNRVNLSSSGSIIGEGVACSDEKNFDQDLNCHGLINDFSADVDATVKMTVLGKMQKNFMEQLTSEFHDNEKFENNTLQKKLEEEKLLHDGITFDPQLGVWNVTYCYSEKITQLQSNYLHVKRRMEKLNEKLKKRPDLCALVNQEIKKNIDLGFWVKCSEVKFPANCQKHYIPFNYVENPSSLSTPCRLVCDSSAKDQSGLSLNQCQIAGRSFIGSLRGCLLKARVSQQIALGDLSKFFNSFKLNNSDASLRRVLVPSGGFGKNDGFDEYCQAVIPFGDKAASILSCMARDKNAEMFSNNFPELTEQVCHIFKHMTYIDDVTANQSWDQDMDVVIAVLESIAESGGLKFKNWTKLGDATSTKYLGYTWDPKEDTLKPRLWFNIGKIERGKTTEEDLTQENIEQRVMASCTKRDILSVQGQFFDPLLILSPIIVKLRLFFGSICEEIGPENWNTQLSLQKKKEFIIMFKEVLAASSFTFPRSCIPRKGINFKYPEGQLICFTDGSLEAYACAVYLRFKTGEHIYCNLLTSGVKTVGVRKLTAPRTELLGAVLGVQVTNNVISEISALVDIKQTLFLTDSRIVLGQLKHASGRFEMYVGSRLDFIQRNSKDSVWKWVPGDLNPADLPTRANSNMEEIQSKKWLHGGFLLEEEEHWPVKDVTNFDDKLPGMDNSIIQANMLVRQAKVSIEDTEETWKNLLDQNNNLSKVATILGICLKFKYPKLPLSERRVLALARLIQDSMPLSKELVKSSKSYDVQIIYEDEAVYARGRTLENLNSNKLVVLSPKSSLANLIFRDYHRRFGHCASVQKVKSKIAENFYIPRSGKPLLAIKKNCHLCRKLMAIPSIQRMGDLRSERFRKSKPFSHILVDCMGPFQAFDSVKKRVTTKVWGLVIACAYTRAVWVTALENYSADAVLSGMSRLKSRFGQFKTVYSDLGTNLIAAGRLDKSQDEDETEFEGGQSLPNHFPDVVWKPGVPKAPWFMGGVECFVKLTKLQLKILRVQEGLHKLTHMEWETLFNRISSILNERPLIRIPEPGGTLCANMLLFGHNDNTPNQTGPQETSLTKRSRAVQENLELWWKIYHENFQKTAASITKWKTPEENLQVNDIVLLLDSPNKVGSYKTGKIVQVYPDSRGLVRKVKVEYKTSAQNRLTQVVRQCRTLSRLTHHNIEHDNNDDDQSDDDISDHDDGIDDDNVDDYGNMPGNNDLVSPNIPQRAKLKVKFVADGNQKIVDFKNLGKKRHS